MIRKLQSQRALDHSDVMNLESMPDQEKSVEKLLHILTMKPPEAYLTFAEALRQVDKDIHRDIMYIMQGNYNWHLFYCYI